MGNLRIFEPLGSWVRSPPLLRRWFSFFMVWTLPSIKPRDRFLGYTLGYTPGVVKQGYAREIDPRISVSLSLSMNKNAWRMRHWATKLKFSNLIFWYWRITWINLMKINQKNMRVLTLFLKYSFPHSYSITFSKNDRTIITIITSNNKMRKEMSREYEINEEDMRDTNRGSV